jgi:hypothetical protein
MQIVSSVIWIVAGNLGGVSRSMVATRARIGRGMWKVDLVVSLSRRRLHGLPEAREGWQLC